jgi:hypothetical protein
MSKEKVYNLFAIFESMILKQIGYVMHEIEGTDEEKQNYLLDYVEKDSKRMKTKEIPLGFTLQIGGDEKIRGISLDSYNTMLHNGTTGFLFEPFFIESNSPKDPLTISTAIVDGKIKIDKRINYEYLPKARPFKSIEELQPNNYLEIYTNEQGFNLDKLLNDDFIEGIQIMYNNRKYVSSLKLILSAIDSISFLEYGDQKDIFKKWLVEFSKLSDLNISSNELWELRNSLLHMTNPYSRKVLRKQIQPLQFYVSHKDKEELQSNVKFKYFNLKSLIDIFILSLENWAESYNNQRDKFEQFIERYDMIVSDSRYKQLKF